MARPITLFTDQWADLPLEELAEKAAAWGFDGLELACWGDHFEVDRALSDPGYIESKRELLDCHGLVCPAVGAHLVAQAVCDRVDERQRVTVPAEVWGDGDPERPRRRRLRDVRPRAEPDRLSGAAHDRVGGLGDGSPVGAQDALAFGRRVELEPSVVAFDVAIQRME